MGLVYHSIDQFHDAIRRKDVVAIELFAQAGGVSSKSIGATGKTAEQLALETGDDNIVQMIAKKSGNS